MSAQNQDLFDTADRETLDTVLLAIISDKMGIVSVFLVCDNQGYTALPSAWFIAHASMPDLCLRQTSSQ